LQFAAALGRIHSTSCRHVGKSDDSLVMRPASKTTKGRSFVWLGFAAFLALLLASCGGSRTREVRVYLDEPFPEKLSQWHLFVKGRAGLQPNGRVIPYDLNTPLFSDYARKHRFVWMPDGASAQYRENGTFDFPTGTILVKSFAFPTEGNGGEEKLIETRLLVHAKSSWVALPYVWNARQSEATLQLVPDPVRVHWTDSAGRTRDFTYVMPNTNECQECHDNNKVLLPIGPKARNLNRNYGYADGTANQLTYWTKVGYLQGAPTPEEAPRAAKWDDPVNGTLTARARAYLDNNCAHCHQPGGTAGYTGVDFRLTQPEVEHLGVCKAPNSAGNMGHLQYDLVPGNAEESILLYRMQSTAPKVMMPQIGRDVVHEEGVALIREWISSLQGKSCPLVSRN
jgi:uncharacterized repeat protein (TIGR03806 family)